MRLMGISASANAPMTMAASIAPRMKYRSLRIRLPTIDPLMIVTFS